MKIEIVSGHEFAQRAAEYAVSQIMNGPTSAIGLAGGRTTVPIHAELTAMLRDRPTFYEGIDFFNIDEYLGAPRDHVGSCYCRMMRQLLTPLAVRPERIHLFDPHAIDPDAECARVRAEIDAADGIDLQYFGIGENGHVGFCNPGTPLGSTAFSFPFDEAFRRSRAQVFGGLEYVPVTGVTLGLQDCMHVRTALLVASGAGKAEIVRRIVQGPVTEDVPASVFRLHPRAVLLLDEAAAGAL